MIRFVNVDWFDLSAEVMEAERWVEQRIKEPLEIGEPSLREVRQDEIKVSQGLRKQFKQEGLVKARKLKVDKVRVLQRFIAWRSEVLEEYLNQLASSGSWDIPYNPETMLMLYDHSKNVWRDIVSSYSKLLDLHLAIREIDNEGH